MTDLWLFQNRFAVRVGAEHGEGRVAVVEALGPAGDMPPLHVHHHDDETFCVLDGELTLFVAGAEPVVLGPGEVALGPRGIPHTYRVTSEAPARWLVFTAPAGFDRFVRSLGQQAASDGLPPEVVMPSPERLEAAAI